MVFCSVITVSYPFYLGDTITLKMKSDVNLAAKFIRNFVNKLM
jgi:hypothetical protein